MEIISLNHVTNMKLIIYILSCFLSIQLFSQEKEKLYIISNSKENFNNRFVIKKDSDSIVLIKKSNSEKYCIMKRKMGTNLIIINEQDLIKLSIQDYIKLIENRNIYLLFDNNKKYEVVEIDGISFYEKPQD